MSKHDKTFFLLIILSMVYVVLSLRKEFGWGDDFAQYILQAKSLVSGDYGHLSLHNQIRAENSTVCLGPTNYPWGFPMLLAPIIALFGMNFTVLQIYLGIFQILFLFAIYALFKKKLNRVQLLMIVAVFVFNPFLFQLKKNIISEIPFLFFCTLSIYLIQRIFIDRDYFFGNGWASFVLMGFALFCVFFVRTAGVVLLLTYFVMQVYQFVKAKKVSYLSFVPYLVFVLLYFAESSYFSFGETSYKNVFGQAGGVSLQTMMINLGIYFKSMSDFYEIPVLSNVLFIITLPFFFIGLFKRIFQDFLYSVFFLGYAGMLLVFPANGGMRLLLPIMPFYFYFFIVGLDILPSFKLAKSTESLRSGYLLVLMIVLISLMAVSYQSVCILTGKAKTIQGPMSEDSKELFEFIKGRTEKEDHIIFWKPRAMILFTDRNSYIIKEKNRILKQVGDYLVEENIGYIHVSQNKDFNDHSKLIFENNSFKMYKILSQKEVCPQIQP